MWECKTNPTDIWVRASLTMFQRQRKSRMNKVLKSYHRMNKKSPDDTLYCANGPHFDLKELEESGESEGERVGAID